MKPIYLHNFSSKKDVEKSFGADLSNCSILLASYGLDNYSGAAFVLFEKDEKLYEVTGGHCSCYGLEGQWVPEETNIKSLKHRIKNGTLGEDDWTGNMFKDELVKIVESLKNKY